MKMWAVILALAIGMALLPGFRDKAEITGKVVVTAVGVDVAAGKADSSGVRVSVQAVETMKTAGSLTEQEKNATEVYAVEGRSIAGSMQAFAAQTGRGDLYSPQQGGGTGAGGGENRTLAPAAGFFHAGS